jgi:hypothetical protein
MRTEAWKGLAGEVKTSGRRLKKASNAYIKAHPLLILGGGAALGALLMSRMSKRPLEERRLEKKYGFLKYVGIARFILGRALVFASDWVERARIQEEEFQCMKAKR